MPQAMPSIDLTGLTPDEFELAKGILSRRDDRQGRLRVSRPEAESGETQYIWRMVAFSISPRRLHHCMPVMAYCYLPGSTAKENREIADRLDEIVDKITDRVPLEHQHGLLRWAASGLM